MTRGSPSKGRLLILSRSRTTLGALGFAAVGALALSACGSNNTTSTSTASSPASSSAAASTSSSSGSGGANGITCASGSLTSSGSTAQSNAVSAWTKAYQSACSGSSINYQGGGSGKGVSDFTAGTDDFAGSDFSLNASKLSALKSRCGSGAAINLPMTPGAIAIGYNLSGVTGLKLSAVTLAKIFTGKITSWDDAAIKADNPGMTLPSTKISTFHRSDTSGTSYNFSNYLSHDASSDWTTGADKQWPSAAGGQGSKGTAGIAAGVKMTDGGIGYMEDSFATQGNISVAEIGDAAGNFVPLTIANTTNFLSKAKVAGTGGDLALKFDYSKASASATSYPNTLVTYEIVCTAGNKNAALLKGFLGYTAGTGQNILASTGYVPLPANIETQVATAVANLS